MTLVSLLRQCVELIYHHDHPARLAALDEHSRQTIFTFSVPFGQHGLTRQDDYRQARFTGNDPHAPGLAASRGTVEQNPTGKHIRPLRHDPLRHFLIELFSRERTTLSK